MQSDCLDHNRTVHLRHGFNHFSCAHKNCWLVLSQVVYVDKATTNNCSPVCICGCVCVAQLSLHTSIYHSNCDSENVYRCNKPKFNEIINLEFDGIYKFLCTYFVVFIRFYDEFTLKLIVRSANSKMMILINSMQLMYAPQQCVVIMNAQR